ncbi:hypothetical protein SYK_02410 [Pseudodesulfovibrio nedwellii]|uniref:Uncharacterized protein n=1 Tax=Pseudodesulfovibrio nedwellii TaxID=2973072 RepID=A0ABM8AWL7_9BACT|nr:hypothetical protein [Pseudodesulfovibrio nedwellii]BDQ35881.1 hypothetical protein SYK_02410 [Pseudodesulfovibrio nedwellii]
MEKTFRNGMTYGLVIGSAFGVAVGMGFLVGLKVLVLNVGLCLAFSWVKTTYERS